MIQLGSYVALDETVSLHASKVVAATLEHAFADLHCDASTARRITLRRRFGRWLVACDSEQRYRGADDGLALYAALIAINELAGAGAAKTGVVLHGSAVEVDGHAVAFVGPSGVGKSTLTAAMVLAGSGFIADEVTALTPDYWVRPFHRPIGLRPDGAQRVGIVPGPGPFAHTYPWRVAGEGRSLSNGAPLTLVLLIERTDQEAGLQKLEPALALHRLANCTLGAQDMESTMFRRLDDFVRRVPVMALRYNDLADGMRLVRLAIAAANT